MYRRPRLTPKLAALAAHAPTRCSCAFARTDASLGREWHRAGASGDALRAYETAIGLSPAADDATLHELHLNTGVLRLATGRTADAVASFSSAVAIRPSSLAAHTMLMLTRPRTVTASLPYDAPLSRALAAAQTRTDRAYADALAEPDLAEPYLAEHYHAEIARALLEPPPPPLPPSARLPPGHPPAAREPPAKTPWAAHAAALATALAADGYAHVDGVLGETSLHALLGASNELAVQMARGSTGRPTAAGVSAAAATPPARTDEVVRLPSTTSEWMGHLSEPLRDGLSALRTLLLRHVHRTLLPLRHPTLPPLWPREEVQYACYGVGASYAPHADEDGGGDATHTHACEAADAAQECAAEQVLGAVGRVYSAVYYANDPAVPWHDAAASGGGLRIWPSGSYTAVQIAPVGDRLVVFDSRLVHEVLPVRHEHGRRCAFTMWYSAVGAG
jgi:hypothetical protein